MDATLGAVRRLALAANVAIVGCSGGGGDDGADPGARVTYAPDSLLDYVPAGEVQGLQRFHVTIEPYPEGVQAVRVLDPQHVVAEVSYEFATDAFDAYVRVSSALAPGTYDGVLTLQLCRDVACADPIPLDGAELPYHVVITPRVVTTADAILRVDGAVVPDVAASLDADGGRHWALDVTAGSTFELEIPFDAVSWSFMSGYDHATLQPERTGSRRLFRAVVDLTDPLAASESTYVRALAADGQLVYADLTVTP